MRSTRLSAWINVFEKMNPSSTSICRQDTWYRHFCLKLSKHKHLFPYSSAVGMDERMCIKTLRSINFNKRISISFRFILFQGFPLTLKCQKTEWMKNYMVKLKWYDFLMKIYHYFLTNSSLKYHKLKVTKRMNDITTPPAITWFSTELKRKTRVNLFWMFFRMLKLHYIIYHISQNDFLFQVACPGGIWLNMAKKMSNGFFLFQRTILL